MARKVVLAGACRTAIGVMGGQFANTSAVELGTIVIKEALKRAGVSPDQDDAGMGSERYLEEKRRRLLLLYSRSSTSSGSRKGTV